MDLRSRDTYIKCFIATCDRIYSSSYTSVNHVGWCIYQVHIPMHTMWANAHHLRNTVILG